MITCGNPVPRRLRHVELDRGLELSVFASRASTVCPMLWRRVEARATGLGCASSCLPAQRGGSSHLSPVFPTTRTLSFFAFSVFPIVTNQRYIRAELSSTLLRVWLRTRPKAIPQCAFPLVSFASPKSASWTAPWGSSRGVKERKPHKQSLQEQPRGLRIQLIKFVLGYCFAKELDI